MKTLNKWTPDELTEQIDKGALVFLKLFKKGCGPCKLSEPAVERLMAADQAGMTFGQISIDEYPEMLEIAETDVLPAFFVFKDRDMKGKFIGFKGLAKLQEFVQVALGAPQPPAET